MVNAVLGESTSAPLLTVTLAGLASDRQQAAELSSFERHSPRKRPRSEVIDRLEQECRVIQNTGYAPAITELIRLGLELKRRGHGLYVEGAAAGSTLLYLIGLTHLNPVEHGLFTERFLDTGTTRKWSSSGHGGSVPDYFKVQASMGQPDFLALLRHRGYGFSVERDTIPGYPSRTISAEIKGAGFGSPTAQLTVETSTLAVLSNFLGGEWDETPNDVQTWHLLAAGDTDGIEPLESAFARDALRSRKPRSLGGLADVLVVSRPGWRGEWARMPGGTPVYQEDLMQLVHDRLGISLRDAYGLVVTLAATGSEHLVETREWFFGIKPPEPLSPREWNALWEKLVTECPFAVCKAHYLVTAHHCLRAACLKAHHPENFRAAQQSLGHRANRSL